MDKSIKMNKFWDNWKFESSKKGRQYWTYLGNEEDTEHLELMSESFRFDKTKNSNSADNVYRYLRTKNSDFQKSIDLSEKDNQTENYKRVFIAFKKAINYYKELLTPNHFITGDYGGPMFLLPGLIIVSYVTGKEFNTSTQVLMKRYILNQQNEDGGWGLHIEGKSTMFGSCLNYVALRLLGEGSEGKQLLKGRNWIKKYGGATQIPSWGKFYLSVLNVYEWEGCNSLFPEMWLFPRWLPFHPSRYWCHARMVYLPMAYCFGNKIKHPLNDTTMSLRKELYLDNYDDLNWSEARNACAATDTFRTPKILMRVLHFFTNTYEKIHFKWLRSRSMNYIIDYINAEDEHTSYINIGPVNQVINSLSVWHRYGGESKQFAKHVDRWKDYLWLAEDGIKMQGYNGAQLWETAFFINATCESTNGKEYAPELLKMYQFIDISQIQKGISEDKLFFRHPNQGGWPFSTVEHGWPITDCTADGIKATINLHQFCREEGIVLEETISKKRLEQAVDLVLSFQMEDGGWASYEKRRAPFWIEALNPSEVFGEIMVDYSYTECSSSSIQGLSKFQNEYPNYKSDKIKSALSAGIKYIKSQQERDGSWYGSWGVCYTYATWFALEALACMGEFYANSESVKMACHFLKDKQREDGSWGESFESCVQMKYVEHENGQLINTAWALLSLMKVKFPETDVIEKGIQFLLMNQDQNGDFPQQGISGVFNKNCMETYTSYRNVFPIWALNRYLKLNEN